MTHPADNQQHSHPPYIQHQQQFAYHQQYYHNAYTIQSTMTTPYPLHNHQLQSNIPNPQNINQSNNITNNANNSHPSCLNTTNPINNNNNTDPLVYLNSHNTIDVSLMEALQTLSKTTHNELRTVNLNIKGICAIGNDLWLKECEANSSNVICFHKIKTQTIEEWEQWIPKQSKFLIHCWKSHMCSLQYTPENILQKRCRDSNKVEKCINKFRGRLINFILAVKKLRNPKQTKRQQVKKQQQKRKQKQRGCWRCGKRNHEAKNCHSKVDINGCLLSENDTQCWRCGKVNHKAKECFSKLDINGCKLSENDTLFKFKPKHYDKKHQMLPHCHCKCDIKNERTCDDSVQIKMEPMNDNINDICKPVILCSGCGVDMSDRDLYRCSKCKITYYCNRKCQLNHWSVHRIECEESVCVKLEKISVNNWTHYGVIYWLNRVNDNMFADIKFKCLRKHIVMGKIKGCDLGLINKVTLRMMGINNVIEQENILNVVSDIIVNDNFDNVLENRMNIDDIPIKYVDPILYELMDEPVKVMQSGYVYDKEWICEYIRQNKSDPMTDRYTDLSDIIECKELKIEIERWKHKYLIAIS